MENSIKILKQIEQTHHGLGISVLFGIIATLGKVSVLYLGEKGTGKGTAITSIKTTIPPNLDMIIDNLTLTEMGNRNELQHCYNNTMVWRIKEWSTMNRWNRELFMTIGAKIITDHEYYHYMGMNKGGIPIVIDIKNTNLIVMIGIQPLKMSRMMRENENWESLSSDRFIKWPMLNALRTGAIDKSPEYDMPFVDETLTPKYLSNTLMTQKMLEFQISPERLPLFAKWLLNGYAILESKTEITARDELDFAKLFQNFLTLYSQVIYSNDIAEPLEMAIGSLRLYSQIVKKNGVSIDELERTFSVYKVEKNPKQQEKYLENAKEMIRRHSHLLIAKGLITEINNSPTTFWLAKPMENFWSWYSDLIK